MKEGWKEVSLGYIAEIYSGYAFKSVEMQNERSNGVPLIKIKNINDRNVSDNFDSYLSNKYILSKYDKYKLFQGDILIAMTGQGSVGRIGKMHIVNNTYYINQRVGIVRVKEEVADKEFIFQQIATPHNELVYYNLAMGAGQPNLSPKDIGNLKVQLPPLPTQRKIASILSGYDNLIENNLKRIKLLEEKAALAYEEWFVKMRFPGYETAVFDEATGLPEGWEKVKLSDVAEINSSSIKKNYKGYIKYIDIASVTPNKINFLTPYDIDDAPGRAKRVVKHGDIIWSCVRPNRKSHAVIWKPELNLIASTGFCVITPKKIPTSYLYQYLTTESYVGYLTNLAGGAAYPAVKSADFIDSDVTVPHPDLLIEFNKIIGFNFDVICNLEKQNRILKDARDILLPRLMSGMVDVEALQIGTLEIAD